MEVTLDNLKATPWFMGLPEWIKPMVEKYPPMDMYVDMASGIVGSIGAYDSNIDAGGKPDGTTTGVMLSCFIPYERLSKVTQPKQSNIIDTQGEPIVIPPIQQEIPIIEDEPVAGN